MSPSPGARRISRSTRSTAERPGSSRGRHQRPRGTGTVPSGRGDLVEVFGPGFEHASLFPAEVTEGIVVAFAVDDIVGAREELAAAGVELVGDVVWAGELFDDASLAGYGWFFFRGPDGNIYVMQQDSRPAAI